MTIAKLIALTACAVVLTGCTTTTVTNLTPSRQPRNSAGLYPFEVAFDTNQQSVKEETLTPYVLIGLQSYPMKPAPVLKNRWETLIPIPPDQTVVHYRYKFDYEYLSIPQRRSSSKLSVPYRLEIVDAGK